MINYVELRQKLKVFDYKLQRFVEIVDCAVAWRAQAYMPKLAMFAHKDVIKQAYDDAESDVRDMSWEAIRDNCSDYEVCADHANQRKKEQKTDWEHQEDKRISSTSIREG